LGFFETFCEHASRTKLRGKTKIVFFGPTDQKLWVFEVSRRSLGRAGMCWSQPARVDHLHKKWRAGRKKISRKMGTAPQAQVSIRGRRATPGRQPALGRRLSGGDLWSPDFRRPAVGAWSPGSDRAPTAGCRQFGARKSVAQIRPATSGRPLAAGRHLRLWGSSNFFEIFLFKKKRIFGSLGDGPGLLREWVNNTSIF
jgi:hypothetical protein